MNRDKTLPGIFPGVTRMWEEGWGRGKYWVRTVEGYLFATACFYTLVKMYNYMACWFKFILTLDIKFSEERLSACLFTKNQASCVWKCLMKIDSLGETMLNYRCLRACVQVPVIGRALTPSAWVTSFSPLAFRSTGSWPLPFSRLNYE